MEMERKKNTHYRVDNIILFPIYFSVLRPIAATPHRYTCAVVKHLHFAPLTTTPSPETRRPDTTYKYNELKLYVFIIIQISATQ